MMPAGLKIAPNAGPIVVRTVYSLSGKTCSLQVPGKLHEAQGDIYKFAQGDLVTHAMGDGSRSGDRTFISSLNQLRDLASFGFLGAVSGVHGDEHLTDQEPHQEIHRYAALRRLNKIPEKRSDQTV